MFIRKSRDCPTCAIDGRAILTESLLEIFRIAILVIATLVSLIVHICAYFGLFNLFWIERNLWKSLIPNENWTKSNCLGSSEYEIIGNFTSYTFNLFLFLPNPSKCIIWIEIFYNNLFIIYACFKEWVSLSQAMQSLQISMANSISRIQSLLLSY